MRTFPKIAGRILSVVWLGVGLMVARGAAAQEAEALKDLPGMDFSSLSPSAQRELAAALSDSFCYCGCPHTVGACLKTHTACHHAKRMARLAASQAALGFPATDITNSLSAYYLSYRDPRIEMTVDERMCRGAKAAKVTIVEFFDFECPHCGKTRPMLEKLVANNPKVRLCAVPFPLPMHPNALPAGQVALLARDHNKYWPVYDALFENQTHLSRELIKSLAVKAGLSAADVDKALASEAYKKELETKRDAAQSAGVDSTPTLFLNGHKLPLPLTPEALSISVEDELEWQAHGGAWAADEAH